MKDLITYRNSDADDGTILTCQLLHHSELTCNCLTLASKQIRPVKYNQEDHMFKAYKVDFGSCRYSDSEESFSQLV